MKSAVRIGYVDDGGNTCGNERKSSKCRTTKLSSDWSFESLEHRFTWCVSDCAWIWSSCSKCEWNLSTTVSGTFSKYSAKIRKFGFFSRFHRTTTQCANAEASLHLPKMNPTVTSSGNRMRSLIFTKFPLSMRGIIFLMTDRLMQKPAPPVANQNCALRSGCCGNRKSVTHLCQLTWLEAFNWTIAVQRDLPHSSQFRAAMQC